MRDLLIFLHVPKTGGTSLERALIERLGPEAVLRFSRANRTSAEIGDELAALTPAQRERVQLLTGHQIWVGIDRFFPERRPRYITWLRDPVARLLANYWKIRRTPQHQLHGRLTALDPQEGLVEFLRGDLTPVVRNHMTVFLGRQGTAGGHDPALCQDWNRELLERALDHLRSFWFVGLQESFRSDLAWLGNCLGSELGEHQVHRAPAGANDGRDRLPLALLEACAARTRMDTLLFHAAVLQRQRQAPEPICLPRPGGGGEGGSGPQGGSA